MVYTGGNNIISAFTGGVPVKSIYTYGQLVWPSEPEPPVPTGYYIRWTPSNISGTFTMEGSTYNLEDYSGYYEFSGSSITRNAFASNSDITTIDTNAELVKEGAFEGCISLSQVSLSVCSKIEDNAAFATCYSLQQIDLPECSYIGIQTFYSCYSLSQVSLPKCTRIGYRAFVDCSLLSDINLPVCTVVENNAFEGCTSLSQAILPECISIRSCVFSRCTSLSVVSLPKCIRLGSSAFYGCTSLSEINLPVCAYIESSAFILCSNLVSVTIGTSSVCTCLYNPFYNTPFNVGTGSIYVPSSLVSEYKSASYWSDYSNLIYPIPN